MSELPEDDYLEKVESSERKTITIKQLKELLEKVPEKYLDYEVAFDSGCGWICRGDQYYNHRIKKLVLND